MGGRHRRTRQRQGLGEGVAEQLGPIDQDAEIVQPSDGLPADGRQASMLGRRGFARA